MLGQEKSERWRAPGQQYSTCCVMVLEAQSNEEHLLRDQQERLLDALAFL